MTSIEDGRIEGLISSGTATHKYESNDDNSQTYCQQYEIGLTESVVLIAHYCLCFLYSHYSGYSNYNAYTIYGIYLLYILYSSPAFILRNLFTESHEQNTEMMSPNRSTAQPVIASTCQLIITVMSGS